MNTSTPFRYRIEYSKSHWMRFTGHLDLLRTWERTFRRAQFPLAFTQGFNPRPRINLGLALPLGFTSDCELMDFWLIEEKETSSLLLSIREVLPPGLTIHNISRIDQHKPTLQKQINAVMYSVLLDPSPPVKQLQGRIDTLLASPEILRERRGKTYDLRPLIRSLDLTQGDGKIVINMCLTAQEGRTGRPEEILLQLNLDPSSAQIHRKQLFLTDPTEGNAKAP